MYSQDTIDKIWQRRPESNTREELSKLIKKSYESEQTEFEARINLMCKIYNSFAKIISENLLWQRQLQAAYLTVDGSVPEGSGLIEAKFTQPNHIPQVIATISLISDLHSNPREKGQERYNELGTLIINRIESKSNIAFLAPLYYALIYGFNSIADGKLGVNFDTRKGQQQVIIFAGECIKLSTEFWISFHNLHVNSKISKPNLLYLQQIFSTRINETIDAIVLDSQTHFEDIQDWSKTEYDKQTTRNIEMNWHFYFPFMAAFCSFDSKNSLSEKRIDEFTQIAATFQAVNDIDEVWRVSNGITKHGFQEAVGHDFAKRLVNILTTHLMTFGTDEMKVLIKKAYSEASESGNYSQDTANEILRALKTPITNPDVGENISFIHFWRVKYEQSIKNLYDNLVKDEVDTFIIDLIIGLLINFSLKNNRMTEK